MKVDATDCCPTVNQNSGFSDFSVLCLTKSHRIVIAHIDVVTSMDQMSVGSHDADPSFPFKNPLQRSRPRPLIHFQVHPRLLQVLGNRSFLRDLELALQRSLSVS